MTPDKARKTARRAGKIHGWFSTEAAMLFALLDDIQKQNNITGDIFEIGCHHGKSTFFLGGMAHTQKEKLCVCDLFGNQMENISGSGSGDLQIFKRNMDPLLRGGLEMRIFRKNSNILSVQEIGNNYRFFHIDGGHNCDEALTDLKLAADAILTNGLIAIDDPFRPEWPGVTEALIRFLDEYRQFRALIVGFNKLILVRSEYANHYLHEIQKLSKREAYGLDYPWHLKELPFTGQALNIVYMPSYLADGRLISFARSCNRSFYWLRNTLFQRLANFGRLVGRSIK